MLALTLVGFAMMTLGVALLLLGEVPLVAGKRIPARRARLIGLVLVSFLPLAWGARQAVIRLLDSDAVQGPVVTWSLFGLCWFVVGVILFRVLAPKRERRQASVTAAVVTKKNPFGAAEPKEATPKVAPAKTKSQPKAAAPEEALSWMEPEPPPAAEPKKSRKPAVDKNPFDFT